MIQISSIEQKDKHRDGKGNLRAHNLFKVFGEN